MTTPTELFTQDIFLKEKKNRIIDDWTNLYSSNKAKSLTQVIGHSSKNVSLTYLRGLEVPELNEEDMPEL